MTCRVTRRRRSARVLAVLAGAGLLVAFHSSGPQRRPHADVDAAASEYVALVSALIAHDPDSASGDTAMPVAGAPTRSTAPSLQAVSERARALAQSLQSLPIDGDPARIDWLVAQLDGVAARASLLAGGRMPFEEELHRLYGIRWSPAEADDLAATREELQRLLPGTGSLASRLRASDARLAVPSDRLPIVFERAMRECRVRTRGRVALPVREQVSVRYVTGRPWSGFSRYLGDGQSVVEVNTSFALTLDRVVDLACHEGYPGHHVLNVLRDQRRSARGWEELAAVPLFSPESFDAEVRATSAASLVFPETDRTTFVRDVLAPLAGISSSEAAAQVRVGRLVARLGPAITDAVARYLGQERDYVETVWALQRDALMEQPQPTLAFVHQFRGFALAYTWAAGGRMHAGSAPDAGEAAWAAYTDGEGEGDVTGNDARRRTPDGRRTPDVGSGVKARPLHPITTSDFTTSHSK